MRDVMAEGSPFQSFFMAGFECSSHRRADGRRLDLLASTGHDRWAAEDYGAVAAHGLRTVRDGVRWHRVEAQAGAAVVLARVWTAACSLSNTGNGLFRCL